MTSGLRRLRLAWSIVAAVQLAALPLIFWRGFPYFGWNLLSTAPLWEAPVAAFHAPGILALTLGGRCCGFSNGSVLGPRVVGGHIRVTPSGLAWLALSNLGAWLLLTAPLAARRRRPAAPSPGEPPPL